MAHTEPEQHTRNHMFLVSTDCADWEQINRKGSCWQSGFPRLYVWTRSLNLISGCKCKWIFSAASPSSCTLDTDTYTDTSDSQAQPWLSPSPPACLSPPRWSHPPPWRNTEVSTSHWVGLNRLSSGARHRFEAILYHQRGTQTHTDTQPHHHTLHRNPQCLSSEHKVLPE